MKFNEKLMDKMLPIATWVAENKYLLAVRDGCMLAFPPTMFASIAIIIQNLPTTFGLTDYLPAALIEFLNGFFGPVANATMNISTLFVVFGIAYNLAKNYGKSQLYAGAIAISSFLMLIPMESLESGTFIPLSKFGAEGMFIGMIVAILSTEVFCRLERANIKIKMPSQVPPAIGKSFETIIPGSAALLIMTIIRFIFTYTPWGNAVDFVYEVLQLPLQGIGASLPAVIAVVALTQFFWWFGIHGTILVNSVVEPIYSALSLENFTAYSNGQDLPNILTSTFKGVFVDAGLIFGIALACIILIARSKRLKTTMRLLAAPAFFNISEPFTFGLPIVLNPTIIIPWILAPVVMVIISYFAISTGIVPKTNGATIVWSTPVFLSGILATGSISGGILQLVNVLVGVCIWYPFLKMLDKQYLTDEKEETKKADEKTDQIENESIEMKNNN